METEDMELWTAMHWLRVRFCYNEKGSTEQKLH